MSEWSHLPNAAHIDRIISDLTKNPKAWHAARNAARSGVWDVAKGSARNAALEVAKESSRDAACDAAVDAVSGPDWQAARNAAWSSIFALIAWDDCAVCSTAIRTKCKQCRCLAITPPSCCYLL